MYPQKTEKVCKKKKLNNWQENPYFELLARIVKRPPEYYRLLLLPLNVVLRRWMISQYCWRHHSLQRQGPKAPLTRTNLNVSYINMVPEGATSLPKKGGNHGFSPAVMPVEYNDEDHDTVNPRVH